MVKPEAYLILGGHKNIATYSVWEYHRRRLDAESSTMMRLGLSGERITMKFGDLTTQVNWWGNYPYGGTIRFIVPVTQVPVYGALSMASDEWAPCISGVAFNKGAMVDWALHGGMRPVQKLDRRAKYNDVKIVRVTPKLLDSLGYLEDE